MRLISLALPLCVLLSSCGAGGLAAVREQAIKDMSCADELKVTHGRTSTSPPTDAGIYYAEGCGKLHRYVVGCNAYGYCPDPEGVDAATIVQRQAALDFACEAASG